VSEAASARADQRLAPPPGDRLRRGLARIGRTTRRHTIFILYLASLSFGVVRDCFQRKSWRRTVRAEFRRSLHQAVAGGLAPTLVTAALIGLGMVYQALYWLGEAGQEGLIGAVLVTVLVRSVAPMLVGLVLLGRSGMVALAEIGALTAGGQVRALEAQGVDPFLLLVLPRACAFALASFTLGVMFVVSALISGYIAGSLLGAVTISLWSLLDRVLLAMRATDFAIFPVKMLVIGLVVALTACLTGFEAAPREDSARLLPRGFVRGVLAVLFAGIALSLAV
jgi:phospholipid/cholesterol/gamma-HCH transport system permease protein